MTSLEREKFQRGSTLVLVMVVIVVLLMVGAAALRYSEQESVNVNRRIESQMLAACADAAAKKVWAEFALHGHNSVQIKPTIVPGSGMRLSISHFDKDAVIVTNGDPEDTATFTSVTLDDESLKPVDPKATSGNVENVDDSNTFRTAGLGGQPYMLVAHCTDKRNNQYEVELLVKFGI